ncbi:MAG TPA: flagellar motor switch protein FliG, partial [Savagea sp.]
MVKKEKEMSGRQKAALLLISLGPELSAQVFKHLSEDEMEKLTLEISGVKKVDSAVKEEIIDEFHNIALAQDYISSGGIGYAKTVLEKAIGKEHAQTIINRLTSSLQVRPFDFARRAEPSQVLNFIQNEHPQTIALVLSYLEAEQAGMILSSLPQDVQADIAKRIATMESTSPEVI